MSKSQSRKTTKPARARLSVVPKPSGWVIHGSSATQAQRVYGTRQEAQAAAKRMINHKDGGEVVVHGRDGRIRGVETFALGADSFAKVSAVEGIFLTPEMRRDFHTLDRKRLSPEARRQWLIAKYGE